MLLILSCDGQLVGSLRVGERLTRGERSRCISCSVLVDAAQLSSLSARPPRELGWVTSSTRVPAALRWRRSAGSLLVGCLPPRQLPTAGESRSADRSEAKVPAIARAHDFRSMAAMCRRSG
jgi:hypothetical protein